MRNIIALLTFLIAAPGFAAIEAYYMRANEFAAFTKHPGIKKIIQSTPGSSFLIDSVTNTERSQRPYRYLLTSGSCQMEVRVDYVLPPFDPLHPYAGPGKMVLDWDRAMTCGN